MDVHQKSQSRTRKLVPVLLTIWWVLVSVATHVKGLTIDNQLVSTKNDCFERIVLGSMLPMESAFRNVDMNSMTECKQLCLKEGEKCKTIAFGISSRGNGTCQLSSKILDKSQKRPTGTIFDPDFDLLERKMDCIDSTADTPSEVDSNSNDIPVPFGTIISTNEPYFPPSGTTGLYKGSPNSPSDDRYSTPSRPFPNTDRNSRLPENIPYPDSEYEITEGGLTRPGIQVTLTPFNDRNKDTIYFSHDGFPMYKYPMLYEQNYPSPNGDRLPATYAPNVPTVDNRYKPLPSEGDYNSSPPKTTPRPVYGQGYGNGYSYGTPVKYGSTRPSFGSYGIGSSRPLSSPTSPYTPGYNPRPTSSYDYERPSTYHPSPPRPLTDTQYAYRPDPGYNERPTSNEPNGYGSSLARPGISQTPINGNDYNSGRPYPNKRPRPGYGTITEGNYPSTESAIETYFNPDDYLEQKWTVKPGSYGGDRLSDRYPSYDQRACFRRVLAGKRVAEHWVRRTLACERVEDCMQECGHEKRFTCEGFNYRLDPSGHGQGDCELIEIPLAQMDLYSSPRNRDSNLLRHPDYDYYERDRNAPSSCRPSPCTDCISKPHSPADYYRPHSRPYPSDPFPPSGPPSGPSGPSGYGHHSDYYRPGPDTSLDKYRPSRPIYEPRPPPQSADYHNHYEGSISSHSSYGSEYHGSSFGGGGLIDRYDVDRPDDFPRPSRWEVQPPSSSGTGYEVHEGFRPSFRPAPEYPPYREPERYFPPSSTSYEYSGRDRNRYESTSRFVPYLINGDSSWGSYGGSYGRGSSSFSKGNDYWGLKGENRRTDPSGGRFNYLDLYGRDRNRFDGNDNSVWNYGEKYGSYDRYGARDRPNYGSQWTRRPGPDECSAKSGEGFRLGKGVVRLSIRVPTITECEKMCFSEDSFSCQTYSYRYTLDGRENCLLCDRPFNLLDYYIDIEPDRDFDIYSMSDDSKICSYPPPSSGSSGTAISNPRNNNAQCFFRAIDSTRFFKSIVRDSLTVRSIGECELECIKSSKFTCRAFAFRYGQRVPGGIIDNCQLSDWPVKDMDKERHLILDQTFDVFERASYGHGCEIQPIVDEKHKKLCYLGYGSAAKLLPAAIKKATSVPTEVECKKECIRYRETTPFKCYSFSFGSHASTYNCEMSDLDQTELKLNVHYRHTNNRDYWLFAWNPFDWTCRDKVTTIGGNRANNDRRMDIFREPGEVTWRHYTVSGKPCRLGSACEKSLVTGFYSCEIEAGEIGSWDYCCKADHPCGYSKGFDYPWCFVGDEFDQWRKCSDRYYPGNSTETHQGIAFSSGDKGKPEHYQRPPRPGGLQSLTDFTVARLWPVTYLYSEGPPNSTELSNYVDCNKENCRRR